MLSIITISYSDIEGLSRTLKSVQQQDVFNSIGHEFELIVVSSGLTKLQCKFLQSMFGYSGFRFVFNEDSGLYNAMNVGFSLVVGTHVLYLNGGDEFYDKTSMRKIIERTSKDEIALFRVCQYYNMSFFVRPGANSTKMRKQYSHQGFVAPLTNLTPKFNEKLAINADSYWMKECLTLFKSKRYPEIIAKFELGGISNRPSLRTIKLRLEAEGRLSAIKEVTKFIMYLTMGAHIFYYLTSIRAGYDRGTF